MINDALKGYLQTKIDSADKSIPHFVLEELRQRILTSDAKFGKTEIDSLFDNLKSKYAQSKEGSLLGKVDAIFKELNSMEKALNQSLVKKPEDAGEPVDEPERKPEGKVQPWKRIRTPKVERIGDDIISMMVAMRWLEFLLDNYGQENSMDVLDYYESIGWISSEVKQDMFKYIKMTSIISPPQEYKVKPTIQDHIINMLFIEKLNGEEITRDMIESLERDFRMLKKGVDELYGI
ncbi:MAG: FlaD/FlaE family flagellar protein [Thermoplasmataceae archaeon]